MTGEGVEIEVEVSGRAGALEEQARRSGVQLRGRPFVVQPIRLSCTRYDAEAGTVGLELWCMVEDEETGESGEVEGALRCRVVALGESGW